jgi:hypothetical protein
MWLKLCQCDFEKMHRLEEHLLERPELVRVINNVRSISAALLINGYMAAVVSQNSGTETRRGLKKGMRINIISR